MKYKARKKPKRYQKPIADSLPATIFSFMLYVRYMV